MIIHVIQAGDTIYSIGNQYHISPERLILDNGITDPNTLVVGQAIVIVYPTETYTVRAGDTLIGIANSHEITLNQLLRNNPFLSDRDYIYTNEILVLRYGNENKPQISTNGYAYPFIDKNILRKTLPFLTYLTIFSYTALADGSLIDIDDEELIKLAKDYGTAPIMSISTLSPKGLGNREVAYSILYNEEIQDRQIENILTLLRAKGYYGLNISIHYMNLENRNYYEYYLAKLTRRLNAEGYSVTLTLIAKTYIGINEVTYEEFDYTGVSQVVNNMLILGYDWGYSYGPPTAVPSVHMSKIFFDKLITQVPPDMINVGISVMGYNWSLPYVLGISKAESLSTEAAIDLASQVGATIYYEPNSASPYFQYTEFISGLLVHHIVWFKDARSAQALVDIVPEYSFRGVGIWNIMNYFSQLWLVINTQYEVEKLLP